MNEALRGLPRHQSTSISEYAAAHPGTIDLTVGLPAYGPPEGVRRALRQALAGSSGQAAAHDRYAPGRGTAAFRNAISGLYARTSGLAVNPETEIVVTHGAAGALWLGVLAATEVGDEVLLTDPGYMLYEPVTTMLGRVPVRVPVAADDGFRLDPARVAERITPRSRLLVINSPANPTGAVMSASVLADLGETARRNGLLILHDEVLDCFSYGAPHVRLPALAPDLSITVNSLSKRFGMAGWRIGWMVARPDVAAEAAKAQTFSSLAVNRAVQDACAAGLADPATDDEVARHARAAARQAERLTREINTLPHLTMTKPAGGFYAFVRVRDLADQLEPGWQAATGATAGEVVAGAWLTRAGVAVVPGSAFGPGGRDHVRISFPGPWDNLAEAITRIRALTPTETPAGREAP